MNTVLTADLVRARMKDGRLEVRPLTERTTARAKILAEAYLDVYRTSAQDCRKAIDDKLADVEVGAHEHRLSLGLRKLISDRATFEMVAPFEAEALRRTVFECAAAQRKSSPTERVGFRHTVLAQASASLDIDVQTIDNALYSDLRESHLLTAFEDTTATRLVSQYQIAQEQAVLLKARHILLRFNQVSPGPLRVFFRALKFRRLLYTVSKDDSGAYVLRINGPHSLFRSGTKYGLQLALLLPVIQAVGSYRLESEVEWFKDREPVDFVLEADAPKGDLPKANLSDDVQTLIDRFKKRKTSWKVRRSRAIIHLPGKAICIPDLTFTHEPTGWQVEFEVLGFWSRAAVWKRIELAQSGLKRPVVFAVSERLRVSEKNLSEGDSGRLYVYKGVMNAAAVERLLDGLRLSSPKAVNESPK